MLHYALAVGHNGQLTVKQNNTLKRAINTYGGLTHLNFRAAKLAAEALSCLTIVSHVTLVRVREDAEGVWRKGRKS